MEKRNKRNIYKSIDSLEESKNQQPVPQNILSIDHKWFLEISSSFFGLHQRATNFIREFYSPSPDFKVLNEKLREVALKDIWFYKSHPEASRALSIILLFFKDFLDKDLDYPNKERVLGTLLEFIEWIYKNQSASIDFSSLIQEGIDILEKTIYHDEEIFIRASSFLKTFSSSLADKEVYSAKLKPLLHESLQRNLNFWKQNLNFRGRDKEWKGIFNEDYFNFITKKEYQIISETQEKLAETEEWDELKKVLDFKGFTDRLHDLILEIKPGLERIYFIFYLLHLPGMARLKDILLIDLKQALESFPEEEFTKMEIDIFLKPIFSIFEELKAEYTEKILDCILALGKRIYQTKDQLKIKTFIDRLIQFGFVYPAKVGLDQEELIKINQNHLKNIRVWLELIECSPSLSRELIAALIANLRIGGVFIADNDLFQRDITKLLNSNIEPCFNLVKQLTSLFPVYFSNIGADDKIREVTTYLDGLSYRNDKLIHFLRKQIHTQSNITHLELIRKIIRFWYDGDSCPLLSYLPLDVQGELKTSGKWFDPVHKIVQKLSKKLQVEPENLLEKEVKEIKLAMQEINEVDNTDRERVLGLIKLYGLLKHKYSFDAEDAINDLAQASFISSKEVISLERFLKNKKYISAMKVIFSLISQLKKIVLDLQKSEAQEDIYYKRHIAAGIPSMYGRYRERKFESLGLIFRLEKLADYLLSKIISQKDLSYMTIDGLRNAAELLDLFREGLELDGIYNQNFNSTLEMFHYSLKTSTFSMNQFINVFHFLTLNIKEIIDDYYMSPFVSSLKIIIPQYIIKEGAEEIFEGNQEHVIYRKSEEFYRSIISSSFLVQNLDNYVSQILETLRSMVGKLKPEVIHMLLNYNPRLIFTPLHKSTPEVDNQTFLGAKAYYLKKLYAYKFPIPPGFILTTEYFRNRLAIKQFPEMYKMILELIKGELRKLEKITKQKYGDLQNPLLLSVRSGTVISMPGAMDSLLNVGMNDQIAESLSRKPGYGWAAWDSYRRLLQNLGMTQGINRDEFDKIMFKFKDLYQIKEKKNFSQEQMKMIALSYRELLRQYKVQFEEDPFKQLVQAINFVFQSWYNKRAQVYRKKFQVAEEWGTAAIVQKMVWGNIDHDSGTGVVFTKPPFAKSSEVLLYGDFVIRSQGEDVVAGLVHTLPISEFQNRENPSLSGNSLEKEFPEIYQELLRLAKELVDKKGYEPQEIEFTFESRKKKDLYILQTRNYTLQNEEILPVFSDPDVHAHLVGTGIGIGKGAMNGIVAFDMEDLKLFAEKYPDKNKILIRPDTVPDDIEMIFECDGLLTARGGVTSHAAVTAVQLGKTCVVNCRALIVREEEKECIINEVVFHPGDEIAIDGHLGNVYKGNYPISLEQLHKI